MSGEESVSRSGKGRSFIKASVRAPRAGAAIGLASVVLGAAPAGAQQAPASLPAVTVDAPVAKKKRHVVVAPAPVRTPARVVVRQVARRPQPVAPVVAPVPGNAAVGASDQVGGNATSGSAYNPRASGITRLPTRLVDTPQTITVVPQQVIQDQHTSTVTEALHNVPGISFFGGEGGTQGDNINIHGYSARNDFYRDGIRDPGWYTRDSFSVENVEVLKGPSSFLFGRGSTGGVVNLTSKLPKFAEFTNLEVAGYSSPGVRTTLDVNRAWGDVAARVVLLGNDTNVTDRDHVVNRRVGIAPSITANITPSTHATLSYINQHDNNVPDYGIPILPGSFFGSKFGAPAPVPKNTFYGTVNDKEEVDAHILTLKLDHEINAQWKIANQTRYSAIDRFVSVRGTQIGTTNLFTTPTGGRALSSVPFGANLYNLYVNNGNYFQNKTRNTLFTNLTDVVGHFDTGFLQHTVNAGLELSHERRDQFRSTYVSGIADRVSLGAPNPYVIAPGVLPATSTDQYAVGQGAGIYAGDQVKIGPYFDLLGGIRYDHLRVDQFSTLKNTYTDAVVGPNGTTPVNLTNTVDFVSWRAGAVVHPVENSSIYFMYGTSFDPSGEFLTITNGQQNSKPVTNETYEIGAKYDLFANQLSLTGALFRVTQKNALELVDSASSTYQQVGTTRVEGFELGIAGKITDRWSVFGGYTYMDGRVLSSALANGAFVTTPGNKLQNVPRNTFALTSTYELIRGLKIGGSAFYTSDRYVNSANTSRVPGYWRFDALGSYDVTQNFAIQLNIWNIANTKNFESLSGFGAAQPGTGRTAVLTARYKF